MNVEAILQQIRERVTAEQDAPVSSTARANGAPLNGSAANSNVNESLTRASAHLAVTGRAWDRLPPVVSNRVGALARLELRIKRTCKSVTRWFTWEQVNFNRAVNDALCDVIEILRIEAHERAQLTNEMHREFMDLRSKSARLSEMLGSLADEARGGHSQLANKLNELAAALRAEQLAAKSVQDQEL